MSSNTGRELTARAWALALRVLGSVTEPHWEWLLWYKVPCFGSWPLSHDPDTQECSHCFHFRSSGVLFFLMSICVLPESMFVWGCEIPWVTDNCELPCRYWELNPGPVEGLSHLCKPRSYLLLCFFPQCICISEFVLSIHNLITIGFFCLVFVDIGVHISFGLIPRLELFDSIFSI